ncbi:hypothetical protein, partial [Allobacillus salarius]|uniref:hypothetical protein n=1 Tax=Allobacillus salarius TaxID=1955272 RepID=UPI001C90F1E0
LTMCLPLPGHTRDFHPLEFTHAGQTKKRPNHMRFGLLKDMLFRMFLHRNGTTYFWRTVSFFVEKRIDSL